MALHQHEASVYVRCNDCQMFGVNMPGETDCGNCGSKLTTLYRPPCCFDEMEAVAMFLYRLLDDIDTVSDIAKDDDRMYRRTVGDIQQRRFEVGSTDGYRVSFTEKLESKPLGVPAPSTPA